MEEGVQEQSFKGDEERTMTDAFSSKLTEVPYTFWKVTLVSKWGIDPHQGPKEGDVPGRVGISQRLLASPVAAPDGSP